jgi:hypothetical protein
MLLWAARPVSCTKPSKDQVRGGVAPFHVFCIHRFHLELESRIHPFLQSLLSTTNKHASLLPVPHIPSPHRLFPTNSASRLRRPVPARCSPDNISSSHLHLHNHRQIGSRRRRGSRHRYSRPPRQMMKTACSTRATFEIRRNI